MCLQDVPVCAWFAQEETAPVGSTRANKSPTPQTGGCLTGRQTDTADMPESVLLQCRTRQQLLKALEAPVVLVSGVLSCCRHMRHLSLTAQQSRFKPVHLSKRLVVHQEVSNGACTLTTPDFAPPQLEHLQLCFKLEGACRQP